MKNRRDRTMGWPHGVDAVLMMAVSVVSLVTMVWLVFRPEPPDGSMHQTARTLTMTEASEMTGVASVHHVHRTPPTNLLTAMVDVFGDPTHPPTTGSKPNASNSSTSEPTGSTQKANVQGPHHGSVKARSHQSGANKAAKTMRSVGSTQILGTTTGPTEPPDNQKIALGWIPSGSNAAASIQLMKESPGINVVSPTWFQLTSGDGSVRSSIEPSVVTYAHAHDIKVWALVDNQYSQTLAHDLVTRPKAVQAFVHALVSGAVAYHLDGINLDFENLYTSDQTAFTHMVAQLHQALGAHGLKLSVDITPDIVFLQDTDAYFHAGLSEEADYVVVMAYDEHWRTDSEPGPVADIPWVNTAINDLLNTGVPGTKLVLGVPFYTYFWHVGSDGSVHADAYGTADVAGILQAHGATSTFDSRLQLGYAKYPKPDGYEEVWFETQKTLQDQLQLVNHLGLAGVAVWSLSFPDTSSWDTIRSVLAHG